MQYWEVFLMAIIRVIKDSDNPYVMLNKTALNDNNLSFKAKGIFAYLMSKPDDWRCQVTDLQNNSVDGRDAIRSGLRELREHGYLIKRAISDEFGKITEWEEILYETPQEAAKEIFKEQTKNEVKKTSINGKAVSGEKIKKSINGFSVNGKSNSGKAVPLLNTNTNDNELNNNDISNTTQSNACSSTTDELKNIIENETHLVITPNQRKKLSNWNKERLIIAIDIFKNLNGKYFAFLEKIYKDNGNFAPKKEIQSNKKKGKFHNYEQRNYSAEEMRDIEEQLLGWK